MKKIIRLLFLLFVVPTIFLSGCAPALKPLPPTFTPLPAPTNTPLPINTLVPTKTLIPPTATVSAPNKSLEFLNGVQVVYIDTFDYPTRWGSGDIKGGVLEITGSNENRWNISPQRNFQDNEGIIADFTYTKGSMFTMYLAYNNYKSQKQFGISVGNNHTRLYLWSGKDGVWSPGDDLGGANLSGNFTLKPNTTYSFLIAFADGDFLEVIWDPSDPSKMMYHREKFDKNWSNLTWSFYIVPESGRSIILFDNYREIKIDSMK